MTKWIKLFWIGWLPCVCLWGTVGLEYQHIEVLNTSCLKWITGYQSIHLLEVDPTLYEIRPIKALDDGIGRESVLSINTRCGALASINGGFFKIGGTFDGRACGALKIGDWYALPMKPRGCIGWSADDSSPIMDRLQVEVVGHYRSEQFVIDGLNRPRQEGEMVLYNPSFHRTTLTDPEGEEVVVVDGVVQSIEKRGSSKIPEKGYVLSIQEKNPLFNSFQVGESLTFSTRIHPLMELTRSEDWQKLSYIVGGAPLLLHPSLQHVDFQEEETLSSFLTQKFPRTAIGILPNGHWLFVVVEKTGYFDGMTIEELSQFLQERGCVCALNLDGGDSSTLVYQGTVKNSPDGDEEIENQKEVKVRRVSDAIVILPRSHTWQ